MDVSENLMNESVPTGTEIVRPFLPARDFDMSKLFYEALGFAMVLDGDEVAIFRMGASGFILQKYFRREWAENFMMQLMVDDLDAWWAHLQAPLMLVRSPEVPNLSQHTS